MEMIHSSVHMGEEVSYGEHVVIEEGVVIGAHTSIGHHVVILAGTKIGEGVTIADHTVLGRYPRPSKTSTARQDADLPTLKIGNGVIIGSGSVLYRGSLLAQDVMVGDLATIRERCEVGERVTVGRGVTLENDVSIGAHSKIQSNAYITAYTSVEDYVFIAPCVITTNDDYMGRTEERFQFVKGPHIKRGARVGGGVTLLPGVTVAEESFIAAGAVVTRDTESGMVYMGVPAKPVRAVPAAEKIQSESTSRALGK
ncbi:acyltransferase [Mechercharimyces sp. CAU 1602]|uniref:acyltransferase n=1 Tax=Mechercharimyces sp. CAU 1602 TaxID=2973933 RepID=UPI0021631CF8|nr:acyltransferase [Mechercharimyces sp. CAU 1602]MCS1352252.1 acetyltransferase [Mechercharimyces sp. CAU 1602]